MKCMILLKQTIVYILFSLAICMGYADTRMSSTNKVMLDIKEVQNAWYSSNGLGTPLVKLSSYKKNRPPKNDGFFVHIIQQSTQSNFMREELLYNNGTKIKHIQSIFTREGMLLEKLYLRDNRVQSHLYYNIKTGMLSKEDFFTFNQKSQRIQLEKSYDYLYDNEGKFLQFRYERDAIRQIRFVEKYYYHNNASLRRVMRYATDTSAIENSARVVERATSNETYENLREFSQYVLNENGGVWQIVIGKKDTDENHYATRYAYNAQQLLRVVQKWKKNTLEQEKYYEYIPDTQIKRSVIQMQFTDNIRIEYRYNKDDLLEKETQYTDDTINYIIAYTYNNRGHLIQKERQQVDFTQRWEYDYTYKSTQYTPQYANDNTRIVTKPPPIECIRYYINGVLDKSRNRLDEQLFVEEFFINDAVFFRIFEYEATVFLEQNIRDNHIIREYIVYPEIYESVKDFVINSAITV